MRKKLNRETVRIKFYIKEQSGELESRDRFCVILKIRDKEIGHAVIKYTNKDFIAELRHIEIFSIEHRQSGLGSLLLKRAERVARQQGYTKLFLNVSGGFKTPLTNFYLKRGWKKTPNCTHEMTKII